MPSPDIEIIDLMKRICRLGYSNAFAGVYPIGDLGPELLPVDAVVRPSWRNLYEKHESSYITYTRILSEEPETFTPSARPASITFEVACFSLDYDIAVLLDLAVLDAALESRHLKSHTAPADGNDPAIGPEYGVIRTVELTYQGAGHTLTQPPYDALGKPEE